MDIDARPMRKSKTMRRTGPCTTRNTATAMTSIYIPKRLYAVHLRTKINDNKMFEFQKQDIDVEITINKVEIAAFEHQLTNFSNPMTHSLKFKLKM